jgi:hypothetical protein
MGFFPRHISRTANGLPETAPLTPELRIPVGVNRRRVMPVELMGHTHGQAIDKVSQINLEKR